MVRLSSWQTPAWLSWLSPAWQKGRVLITATGVAAAVLAPRLCGFLEPAELGMIDQFFRLRPPEPQDARILIVGITEEDLQTVDHRSVLGYPTLTDESLAALLNRIKSAQPRAIGLDLYRDLAVDPGTRALEQVFRTTPNLVGIAQLRDRVSTGVAPPQLLADRGQVGFNNVVFDSDQRARRSLLYWHADGKNYESFTLKLAQLYLQPVGIGPMPAPQDPQALQLGKATLRQLQPDDGVYSRIDDGGYQVLVNFRGRRGAFKTVSMGDLLAGKVPAQALQDRIVLIGSVATSLKDFSATPYSLSWANNPERISGVELQANFISQITSAALDGRTLLQIWPEPLEWGWIWVWAWLGTYVSWRLRSPYKSVMTMGVGIVGLLGIGYGGFLAGWILPVVPPLLALLGTVTVVTAYIAHAEEELKRSKEFLHRIINSIPDPIFVKDRNQRWIVLNEAYARLIGLPIGALLGKTAHDVFDPQLADLLQGQDQATFQDGLEQEAEAEFTNLRGETYHVSTKRSLHRDGGGNLFLVGVIRDITKRKIMEEELRRTTAELSRYNEELRLSQDHLNYLANHDALTGLPNRACFQEKVAHCLEGARLKNYQLALLFLDLDGFKQVNDNFGHPVGDLLLQAVARRLTASLRGSDTVARLGGDEFVVILPNIPGIRGASRVARKILATLSEDFGLDGHTVRVTTSIGISLYPDHSQDLDTLMQQADAAMYHAKEKGKNQFYLATPVSHPATVSPDSAGVRQNS
jgi:diguanylate cyclase (GGDEF)-like protein/PAS domain S-box-containing protein